MKTPSVSLQPGPRDYRQLFAAAAWHIGSSRGRSALTIRAIADEVNVSAALLYAHFDDKAALFAELHRFAAARLAAVLDEVRDDHARLFGLCCAYVRFIHEHTWLYEPGPSEPGGAASLIGHRLELVQRVAPLLPNESPSPIRVGAGSVADHLWLGVHGFARLTAGTRSGIPLDAQSPAFVTRHIELLLQGLGVSTTSAGMPRPTC